MDVANEVFRFTQEYLEFRFAIEPTDQVTVGSDNHFDQSWRSPILSQQASKDRLELIADLHSPELVGAVLPNLVGFTDGGVVGGHVSPNAFIAAVIGSEKNTGSTLSTMSPDTSKKLRLFSSGTNARRAPLSIATCSGSASVRRDLMFP